MRVSNGIQPPASRWLITAGTLRSTQNSEVHEEELDALLHLPVKRATYDHACR